MTSGEIKLINKFLEEQEEKDKKRLESLKPKATPKPPSKSKKPKDNYRYLNKNKTFIWHKAKKRGQFKIDDKYNIISGKHKGKHYKDILKWCDRLLMVYEYHAGMATLEIIK